MTHSITDSCDSPQPPLDKDPNYTPGEREGLGPYPAVADPTPVNTTGAHFIYQLALTTKQRDWLLRWAREMDKVATHNFWKCDSVKIQVNPDDSDVDAGWRLPCSCGLDALRALLPKGLEAA